jgi:two-component system nitrate/nitrite sensor histidine kinase NarX
VQESLSNVRKHARASRIDVKLSYDGECVLSVRDDGIGLDTARTADDIHVGLSIMRERAHRIGAKLTLDSIAGQGTLVHLVLPHRSDTDA